jgi:hypothetical protein
MRISTISNNYLTKTNNLNKIEGNPKITPSLYTEGSDNDSRTKSNDYTTP